MKCISLWQPWASLIGRGKSIETRSWQTPHRGRIAIHAAKRWKQEERDIYCSEPFKSALKEFWFFDAELPFGAIVATARLVDCRPTSGDKYPNVARWVTDLPYYELAFGNYDRGRYGWFFRDIHILPEPIPYRGEQGMFEIPYDEEEEIAADMQKLETR